MDKIKKYLDIRYEKHKQKWDTLIVVEAAGDTGIGKSNLALHILDYWMSKLYGECKEEHISQVGMTTSAFQNSLADSNKMECCVYDEAGELSSRRALSKFNVKLVNAYKVIRADLIFTVLVIDDIFDLDPAFRKKRAKALFTVTRRGRVEVRLKNRLRALLSLNQGLEIKNRNLVPPSFRDKFPEYKGILAKPYDKLKEEKTTEARKKLREDAGDDKKISKTLRDIEKQKIKHYMKDINKWEQEFDEWDDEN